MSENEWPGPTALILPPGVRLTSSTSATSSARVFGCAIRVPNTGWLPAQLLHDGDCGASGVLRLSARSASR